MESGAGEPTPYTMEKVTGPRGCQRRVVSVGSWQRDAQWQHGQEALESGSSSPWCDTSVSWWAVFRVVEAHR